MYYCNVNDITQVKELKNQILPKGTKNQEDLFYATVDKWIHDLGRLPNADEFPPNVGVDSLPAVKKLLGLKKLGNKYSTTLKALTDFTGKTNKLEMEQTLNKIYKDYNFKVHIIEDEAIVELEKRPTDELKEINRISETDIAPDAIGHLLDRISDINGIHINEVTTKDVATLENFPGAATLRGFILNGEIYINTDNATPNTKIHELMHMFMGGIRFENPELYKSLINIVLQDKAIAYKMNQFRHRTEMDRAEEVLVEEVSKYLIGADSSLDHLDATMQYELDYNLRRLLDTMLNGDFSNKIIESSELYESTLAKVAEIVNSNEIFNGMSGTISDSFVHRTLNNYKSNLLRTGKLKEYC